MRIAFLRFPFSNREKKFTPSLNIGISILSPALYDFVGRNIGVSFVSNSSIIFLYPPVTCEFLISVIFVCVPLKNAVSNSFRSEYVPDGLHFDLFLLFPL